ncbi:hypothetical protein [Anaplasma centrale]|nr:hypothetical protein [Anaplasma centrale]
MVGRSIFVGSFLNHVGASFLIKPHMSYKFTVKSDIYDKYA